MPTPRFLSPRLALYHVTPVEAPPTHRVPQAGKETACRDTDSRARHTRLYSVRGPTGAANLLANPRHIGESIRLYFSSALLVGRVGAPPARGSRTARTRSVALCTYVHVDHGAPCAMPKGWADETTILSSTSLLHSSLVTRQYPVSPPTIPLKREGVVTRLALLCCSCDFYIFGRVVSREDLSSQLASPVQRHRPRQSHRCSISRSLAYPARSYSQRNEKGSPTLRLRLKSWSRLVHTWKPQHPHSPSRAHVRASV